MRATEATKAIRQELREADISLGRLLGWIGGAIVSGAVATGALNLIHHTPPWLLAAFFLGAMLLASGWILRRIDRRAQGARDWAEAAMRDYKRRFELSLELRAAADTICNEYATLREFSVTIHQVPEAEAQLELDTRIEWFRDYADRLATRMTEQGVSRDQADRYRVRRESEGRLIPPAVVDQGKLDTLNDLLNSLGQYRDGLTRLAVEQVRED
jgi:hypothetical protein